MTEKPTCLHCGELFAADEEIEALAHDKLHYECRARMIFGSVAHIERRCSCFVEGSTENDPPDMTVRQAAKAALAAYHRKRRER